MENKKNWINNLERDKDNINDYNKNKIYDSNISANNKIENKFNLNKNINSNEAIYNNFMKKKSNELNNIFYNPQNSIFQGEDNKLYAMNPYSPNIIKNNNFEIENNFNKLFVSNENNIANYNNIISNNRINNNTLNNQNILNNNNNRDFISKYFDSLSPISPIKNAVESPNNKILSPINGLLTSDILIVFNVN